MKKLNLKRDTIAIFLAIGIGIYFSSKYGFTWFSILLLSLGLLFSLVMVYGLYVMPILAYNSSPKLKDEYHLEFSENGIDFKTNSISSKLEWSIYSRVLENNFCYLLYYGKNEVTVIPKSVFQNDQDIELFNQLIKKKIKRISNFT